MVELLNIVKRQRAYVKMCVCLKKMDKLIFKQCDRGQLHEALMAKIVQQNAKNAGIIQNKFGFEMHKRVTKMPKG